MAMHANMGPTWAQHRLIPRVLPVVGGLHLCAVDVYPIMSMCWLSFQKSYHNVTRIRDYTADGQLTSNAIVLDAGFEKASMIIRKFDNMLATIKDMNNEQVIVTSAEDGQDYILDVDKLIGGEWKHAKVEKVKEPAKEPLAWKDLMTTGFIKATVVQRLHEAMNQHPNQTNDLELFQKPKGVTATAHIAKNKCVLIPMTNKVEVVKKAEAKEPSAVAIKLDVEKHGG